MNLIYINEIGLDYKGQKQYEFIFSDSKEFDMEDWFVIPASTVRNSLSPDLEYVKMIGLLKDSNVILELIQNSDYFGVIDAVHNVVSLAWEKFDSESEDERLYFKFGESIDSVEKKLFNRNHKLIKHEIKYNEI